MLNKHCFIADVDKFTSPNVNEYATLLTNVFNGTVVPTAHPVLPLPPTPGPGDPAPPYATLASIQPFNVELVSVSFVPGTATYIPEMLPVNIIFMFCIAGRWNANLKLCVVVRLPPADKFGPIGK